MTDLFQSLDDLKPFLFRIMDNGGRTADRFTIVTCDGDYFAYSETPCAPQGVGLTGEDINVQVLADWEESGEARDLRWIDLPEQCRRSVMGSLNYGFRDWIESEACATSREEADNFDGSWRPNMWKPENPIYRDGGVFRVRDDERRDHGEYGVTGDEPFATFREAVLRILPEDHCLSGPEYHTSVDLWDETGGPAPLWDYRDDEKCGQCEGTGIIKGGLGGDREDEECPVCDGSGDLE